MADSSILFTPGAGPGAADARTESTNGDYRQVIVLGDPSVNEGVAQVENTDPNPSTDYGLVTRPLNQTRGNFLVNASLQVAGTDVSTSVPVPVGGTVAHGAADSGNPIKIGGKYNSSAPSLSNGQRSDIQVDSAGNLKNSLATLLAGEDILGNGGQSGQVLGVIQKPVVTSGYSGSRFTNIAVVTKANLKNAAGLFLSVYVTNVNAAVRYFQVHNKATAPAATDVPVLSFPIPAGTATVPGVLYLPNDFFLENGDYLATGVGWAISTTLGTFTDSATAAEHTINGYYL